MSMFLQENSYDSSKVSTRMVSWYLSLFPTGRASCQAELDLLFKVMHFLKITWPTTQTVYNQRSSSAPQSQNKLAVLRRESAKFHFGWAEQYVVSGFDIRL